MASAIIESVSVGRVRYQLERVRCGKIRCTRCTAGGPAHGPYWYAYDRHEGARASRRYLGKALPAAVEAARTLARARRDRDRVLEGEAVLQPATALRTVAELLLEAEEYTDRPFAEGSSERLPDLVAELEEAAEDLGQAMAELRRRVGREVRRLHQRLEAAQGEEEEDE